MNSIGLIFKPPQLEIKALNEYDWKMISEKDFLIKLMGSFKPITPVICEMFQGREIITHNCNSRTRNIR